MFTIIIWIIGLTIIIPIALSLLYLLFVMFLCMVGYVFGNSENKKPTPPKKESPCTGMTTEELIAKIEDMKKKEEREE